MKYNNFCLFLFLCLSFKISLDFSYFYLILSSYSYVGFNYESAWFEVVVSYILTFLIFALVYKRDITPSYYFLTFLLAAVYVPYSTIYAYSSFSSNYFYQVSFLFFALVLFQNKKIFKIYVIRVNTKWVKLFTAFLIVVTLIFMVYSFYKMNFSLNYNLNLLYQTRDKFHELVANGLLGYLYTWITKSILIFFMAYSLYKEKYIYFLLFISCQFFIAGMANHKAVFLTPFLIALIYIVLKRKISPAVFVFGFLILVIISCIGSYFGSDEISDIFLLRMLFVPVLNDHEYYVFFQNNPFVYLSNSIMSYFVEYQYTDSIPHIIGYGRWDAEKSSFANTGIFGSGYMHFGFFGMFIFTLIISIVLKIIDSVSAKLVDGYLLVVPLFIIPIWSVNSSDLGALLFSHGVLLSLFLLLIPILIEKRSP